MGRKAATIRTAKAAVRVSDFMDYKEYLGRLYEYMKSCYSKYSYAQFAEDLGFSKSNVVWLFIAGKRKLSDKSSQKIMDSLGLTGLQRRYFGKLVLHNNARVNEKRELYARQLVALKQEELGKAGSGGEQENLEYFAEWYYPVIREMLGLSAAGADVANIAANLYGRLMPKEIKASLALLERLGLIEKDSEGNYIQSGGSIRPDRKVGKLASIRFHEKMLDIARESITRVPAKSREYNAMTVRLSENGVNEINTLIHEMCEKVLEIESRETENAERIYQMNVQLFPLTKPAKIKGDGDDD